MKHICPNCKSENILITLIDSDEIKDCKGCGHSWPIIRAGYDIVVDLEIYDGCIETSDAISKFNRASAQYPASEVRLIERWSDGTGSIAMEYCPIDQPVKGHA